MTRVEKYYVDSQHATCRDKKKELLKKTLYVTFENSYYRGIDSERCRY